MTMLSFSGVQVLTMRPKLFRTKKISYFLPTLPFIGQLKMIGKWYSNPGREILALKASQKASGHVKKGRFEKLNLRESG